MAITTLLLLQLMAAPTAIVMAARTLPLQLPHQEEEDTAGTTPVLSLKTMARELAYRYHSRLGAVCPETCIWEPCSYTAEYLGPCLVAQTSQLQKAKVYCSVIQQSTLGLV